jgi:TRAP-type C4-dicarboxylate transport system permease small subunit
MTKQRKFVLWVCLLLSVPASLYGGMNFIYYSWQTAAVPSLWPPERAAPLAYSFLALAVLSVGVFVYSVAMLIKATNRQ